jgi:hypothetical protein
MLLNFSLSASSISSNIELIPLVESRLAGYRQVEVNWLDYIPADGYVGQYQNGFISICKPNLQLVWEKYQLSTLEVLIHEAIHAIQFSELKPFANKCVPSSTGKVLYPHLDWVWKEWLEQGGNKIMKKYDNTSAGYKRELEAFSISRLVVLHLEGKLDIERGPLLNAVKGVLMNLNL